MTLAFTQPCRHRSAHPAPSRPSGLRPGTALRWRAVTTRTVRRPARRLHTGFPYTPVLSMATGLPPTLRSPSPHCSSSSVLVAQGRSALRPLVIRPATTVLACSSHPQPPAFPTALANSCRAWREHRACQSVGSACSPLGWQPGRVPEHGSRVRRIDGRQAPRPLDLCLTRTGASVAPGCLFFIWYGEAWPHHRLL